MNDSDWEIYKQISRDAEESDSEEETLKLQVTFTAQFQCNLLACLLSPFLAVAKNV